jgi:hypothetical protein
MTEVVVEHQRAEAQRSVAMATGGQDGIGASWAVRWSWMQIAS